MSAKYIAFVVCCPLTASACYYRYALNAYAEVQRFVPTVGEGVPYESFLLMGRVKWDPHR